MRAALTFLVLATSAVGTHAQQREATPFEFENSCFVTQADLATPGGKRGAYSAERIILDWYVWGGDAVADRWHPHLERFGHECFNRKDKGRCGLSYDKKMFSALTTGIRNQDVGPGGIVYEYFQQKPPTEAIRFAARGVGLCFGADNPALSEIDWGQVNYPFAVCNDRAYMTTVLWRRAAGNEKNIKAMDAPYRESRAWGYVVNGMGLPPEVAESASCLAAPNIMHKALAHTAGVFAEDATRQENRRIAAERFANRPVAERIAGLNGCQIAYSLVFNGINAPEGRVVGRVPDGAISWALDYEKANLADEPCPPMPEVLSTWVQQQPLERFEPVQDPYAAFRARKGPSFGNDTAAWASFARIWMSRYETRQAGFAPIAPSSNPGSWCDAVLYYARSNAMGPALNADNGASAFQTLARLGYGNDAEAGICQFAPVSIFPAAKQAWTAHMNRQQQAAQRAAAPKPVAPTNLPQQNYLWKSAPTTRCYWAGDTKQGQRQVCFTN